MDPHSPDNTLNVTAVGVLHTTELPQYHGLPGLDAVAQRIPGVVEYLVRCVGLLLQSSTVPDGPILRNWVHAPVDYARNAVVSLNWRPFLLSDLKCGSHVPLLEFVRGPECLQVKTRRTMPFLIDMKIFYALLKMSFAASSAPWHVDQFLLEHPLLYRVWHPYKYLVEITYKAFAPIIRRDTPLPIRRKLAGLHQVKTTSSSVSTTSERMGLLLEHIAEDPDAPLLTHTENMLAEIGITADEGNVVCSTFRLYPFSLYITVSLCFYLSLAVLRLL